MTDLGESFNFIIRYGYPNLLRTTFLTHFIYLSSVEGEGEGMRDVVCVHTFCTAQGGQTKWEWGEREEERESEGGGRVGCGRREGRGRYIMYYPQALRITRMHARNAGGAAEDSGSRLETRLEVERGYRYQVDMEKNGNSIHPTAPHLDLTHGGFNLSRTVCEVYVICLNSANLIVRTPFSKEGFTAAY